MIKKENRTAFLHLRIEPLKLNKLHNLAKSKNLKTSKMIMDLIYEHFNI